MNLDATLYTFETKQLRMGLRSRQNPDWVWIHGLLIEITHWFPRLNEAQVLFFLTSFFFFKFICFCVFFFKFFKMYLFFNWRIIASQNFVIFCQTSIWISHRYTYIPSLSHCRKNSVRQSDKQKVDVFREKDSADRVWAISEGNPERLVSFYGLGNFID